jgi:CRP-like cAMP-binding protein
MNSPPNSFRNRLLAALKAPEQDLLFPLLETVPLNLRQVLEFRGEPVTHAYFPESGVASVVARTLHHWQIEVGMIGFEGMTGLSVPLGVDRAANETVVQGAGSAVRIAAAQLREVLTKSPVLHRLFGRYVHVFMCQASQTALANGRARLEERLARWILMWHDRLGHDDIPITHDLLSLMLGVRRPGITVALHVLEGLHLIKSSRKLITVLDREGLVREANGAYGLAEAEYERLLGEQAEVD